MQKIDFNVKYTPKWGQNKLSFGLDLFNILNTQHPTEYVSTAENGGSGLAYAGFGLPSTYQTPRYVRLSMSYKY
jgi:outer membrane receptor protein involved in Fe transport